MASRDWTAFAVTSGRSNEEGRKGEEGQREDEDLKVAGSRGEEGEEGKEDEDAVKASPFDKVPDELLEDILSLVFEGRPKPPTSLFTVCKRFYIVGRPQWFKTFDNVGRASSPHLLVQADVHPVVRQATVWFSYEDELDGIRLKSALSALFKNLTELTITGSVDLDPSFHALPLVFSTALRALKHLRRLRFDLEDTWEFEDVQFTIGHDLPHLSHLELYRGGLNAASQMLSVPCPALRHLVLDLGYTQHEMFSLIPWSTLTTLRVRLDVPDDFSDLAEFIESAASSCTLPLHDLVLVSVFLQKDANAQLEVRALFRALGRTSLQRFEFSSDLPWGIPDNLAVLSSVKHLSIHQRPRDVHYQRFFATNDILELRKLLNSFPSLTYIHLDDFRFNDAEDMQACHLLPPDSVDFAGRLPHLLAMLAVLRATTVLRFEWSVNEVKYVWSRSRSEEDFGVDRYRPY
ncbi:hypothetical protein JCM8547_004267 [Rhodosporidiobolus lusitaniae]